MAETKNRLCCSFCGKSHNQVIKLIAGPGVYVCNECVDLCNEILEEETEVKLPPLAKRLNRARPLVDAPISIYSSKVPHIKRLALDDWRKLRRAHALTC